MADQFIEGFDKYGPIGMGAGQTSLTSLLTASEWNVATANLTTSFQIVAGLSTPGQALQLQSGVNTFTSAVLTKTLSGNLTRIIGGVRLAAGLGAGVPSDYITFTDGGTSQVTIVINGGTGQITLATGNNGGATIGTASSSLSNGAARYLEWDITIGASAAYQLWLDGGSVLNGNAANTRGGTSNNFVNGITFAATGPGAGGVTSSLTLDDLYIFDTTGAVNNAVLLTSPRVETQLGTADSAVQFSAGASTIGQDYSLTTTTSAPGANTIFLRKFTPVVNMTLNSVSCLPETTSAGANFKSVLYTDSGGGPNTLVATGTQATGTTSGTKLTSAFSVGQALTGGTPYWIGFITDTSVVLALVDSGITGQSKANTYASGGPATLSGMTTGQPDWLLVGNCTASASNYPSVTNNPPLGDDSYVSSLTPGNEDLFTFPALTNAISAIYTVAMKAYVRKTDGGARTMDLDMKSGVTDGNGSATGLTMSTSYTWITSYFDNDPNTAAPWTATALNAATSGYKIAT